VLSFDNSAIHTAWPHNKNFTLTIRRINILNIFNLSFNLKYYYIIISIRVFKYIFNWHHDYTQLNIFNIFPLFILLSECKKSIWKCCWREWHLFLNSYLLFVLFNVIYSFPYFSVQISFIVQYDNFHNSGHLFDTIRWLL